MSAVTGPMQASLISGWALRRVGGHGGQKIADRGRRAEGHAIQAALGQQAQNLILVALGGHGFVYRHHVHLGSGPAQGVGQDLAGSRARAGARGLGPRPA